MTENLIPKLNDYEYRLLISCLKTGGDGECEDDLTSLLNKVQDKTIETNTYTRTEGC